MTSFCLTGAIASVKTLGWLQNIELSLFDQMVRLQAAGEVDDRFLVVEITDEDLQKFREIYLTDEVVATALEKLQQQNPAIIGLDIYRNIPNPPGTTRLAQQLLKENVFAIYNPQHGIPVDETTGKIKARQGFNLVIIDSDNVQRRNLLALQYQEDNKNVDLYSFGLLISQAYLGAKQYPIKLEPTGLGLGERYIPPIEVNSGGYQLPQSEARGWQALLQFSSQEYLAPSITISDVVSGNFDPRLVQGKIVLIGSTAKTQKDTFITPYSVSRTEDYLTPGVFLHAQAIQQILNTVEGKNSFFSFWTESQELVWIFFWATLGGATPWLFNRFRLFVGVSLGGFLIFGGCSYGLFLAHVWVPIAAPAIALTASWGCVLAYRLFYEEKYDVLTGLPNSRSFLQALSTFNPTIQASTENDLFAVLSVDIDRFKSINESYGHYYGDTLLKLVVQRIRSQLKNRFKLARMGANEFGILINTPQSQQQIIEIVRHIENQLKEPFDIDQKKLYLTCSTGVALHASHDCISAEELWLQAHTAMNRAKKLTKSSYQVFSAGMQTQSLDRLTIESDLRQAIEFQEFQLLYQPIFSLKTNTLQGFEALVRWNSPTRGLVSPNDFINIAEETDLILPISQWVLEEGCRQFKAWQETFHLDNSLTISINLSSRQFGQSNLKEQIEKTLTKTNLNPKSLKLEITESMVIEDIEDTIKLLNDLKTLNVKLSIDDFGTGYSSLSYLNDFPVDTIKIDRSFVKKISRIESSLAIPNAVIELGHNLGMDIIAEGIENIEQLDILRELDCEFGQGFFFSMPLSASAAQDFIIRFSRNTFNPEFHQESKPA
jgi:diguanylate cyclase (GGDEF)-like protein